MKKGEERGKIRKMKKDEEIGKTGKEEEREKMRELLKLQIREETGIRTREGKRNKNKTKKE